MIPLICFAAGSTLFNIIVLPVDFQDSVICRVMEHECEYTGFHQGRRQSFCLLFSMEPFIDI